MTQQRGTETPHCHAGDDHQHPAGICSGDCRPGGLMGTDLDHEQADWPPMTLDDGTQMWGGLYRHDELHPDGTQTLGEVRYRVATPDRTLLDMTAEDYATFIAHGAADLERVRAAAEVPRPRR